MSANYPLCSIVIRAYNEAEYIRRIFYYPPRLRSKQPGPARRAEPIPHPENPEP